MFDARHGRVELRADGSFDYVPDAGYSGPDSFLYAVLVGGVTTASARVDLTVSPAAAAPVFDVSGATGTTEIAVRLGSADLLNFAFEWLVPGFVLAVPGLLLLLILVAQGAAAAVWLPAIRRFRHGVSWRPAGGVLD
jgi:hypothetical protein